VSTLGTLAVSIVGDTKGLEKTFDGVNKRIDDFSKKMKAAGEKVTKLGKDLSLKLTAPITAAGIAAFKLGADLEDAMGATDQIFKKASGDMKKWADSLESYYGIAEKEALEYANMMGSMLINIGGLTEEQAAKQAQTLIKLAGDLTAMFGGTTEDAVRALTGALKGNNTMLDNYGMAVNDALIKTKAMEMGLIAEGEQLTLAAKQAATLALIMEQTGAAQGQAAREAEGASGTMRSLTTEIKNLGSEIGQILIPIITPFIAKVRDLITNFKEMSPEAKKIIIAIAGIAAAAGPVLIVVGKLITAIGAISGLFATAAAGPIAAVIAAAVALAASIIALWRNSEEFRDGVIAVWETIKTTVGPVIDMLRENIGSMIEAAKPALETLKNAFLDLRPILEIVAGVLGTAWAVAAAIFTGVINGIIKAIAPLVQAFGGLLAFVTNVVNAIVALFRGDFAGAWDYLKKAAQGFVDFLAGAVKAIFGFISGLVQGVINFFKNLYNALVGHSIIPDLVNSIISWIKKLPGKALEFAKGFVRNITDTIAGLPARAFNWGKDIVNNLWAGMKNIFNNLKSWFTDNVVSLINRLNPFTKHSPSLVEKVWAGVKEIERAYKSIELPELALTAPNLAYAGGYSGGINPIRHEHSGRIVIEGVNNQGEFIDAVEAVLKSLDSPRVRQKMDRVQYEIKRSRLAPQGAL
jgi:phage-related protein